MPTRSFSSAWQWLLDLIAPYDCAACGSETPPGQLYCEQCEPGPCCSSLRTQLDDVPIVALGDYSGPLKQAIGRFKFERRAELAVPLANALHEICGAQLVDANLLPVPLHPARLAERGFNQSALLTAQLARSCAARHWPRALLRASYTRQQARLGRAARETNLQGQIQVGQLPTGKLVLVDDVVTTGSTMRACMAAIRRAGGKVSLAVALAHSL